MAAKKAEKSKIRIKTNVKAGGRSLNHNERLR